MLGRTSQNSKTHVPAPLSVRTVDEGTKDDYNGWGMGSECVLYQMFSSGQGWGKGEGTDTISTFHICTNANFPSRWFSNLKSQQRTLSYKNILLHWSFQSLKNPAHNQNWISLFFLLWESSATLRPCNEKSNSPRNCTRTFIRPSRHECIICWINLVKVYWLDESIYLNAEKIRKSIRIVPFVNVSFCLSTNSLLWFHCCDIHLSI